MNETISLHCRDLQGRSQPEKTSSLSSHDDVVNRRSNIVTDRDTCHKMVMKLEWRAGKGSVEREEEEKRRSNDRESIGSLVIRCIKMSKRRD